MSLSKIMTSTAASNLLLFLFLSITLFSSVLGKSPAKLEREKEQLFHSSRKELVGFLPMKATKHDSINPPTTVYPTTPVINPVTTPVVNPVTTPVNVPPENSAPTIVTVPATNPNTGFPNPVPTPLSVPSTTTPVPVPNTNPINSPVPITNPVTTPSMNPPVTNPVTTNPTPVAPPATTTNAPIAPGQSWCVAKNGAAETGLQSALDYACGIGGADCSAIQQGGSCYNPVTLQNHASYAFNNYFQKNPTQTSCDFGGTAVIINSNPSTGTCTFLNSASSTSTPVTSTPTITTPAPGTTVPTTASTGALVPPSTETPPTVFNAGNPALGVMPSGGVGDGSIPPTVTTSISVSHGLKPFMGFIVLVSSLMTRKLVSDIWET